MKKWLLFFVLFTFAFSFSSPALWAGKVKKPEYPWILTQEYAEKDINSADGQFTYTVGDLIACSNTASYQNVVNLYFAAILPDNSVMVERVCVSGRGYFATASAVSFRLTITEAVTIGYTAYQSARTLPPLMVTLIHVNGRYATFQLTPLP